MVTIRRVRPAQHSGHPLPRYFRGNVLTGSTETAVPYTAFKNANYQVHFATETGKKPECDKKMLQGITQKLLVRPLITPLPPQSICP